MHGGGCLGPEKPSPRPPSNYPLMIILGNIHLKFYPESRAKTKIRIFMCDLFLVVALHYVCLFCIFMRKNSRKINMVIGQTNSCARNSHKCKYLFRFEKSPCFFAIYSSRPQNIKTQSSRIFGNWPSNKTDFFFFVCVQLSIIIAVPPTSLSLQYFTQPATVCIRQKWSTFLPYLV